MSSQKAWYKVVIDHGPGHQSRTVRYLFSRPSSIRLLIEDGNYEWPIFKIRKVHQIPIEIKNRLIEYEVYKIKSAEAMLKILKKVKGKK